MASGGDVPRLPETDDPFVLLGVPPAADDKQVRQAYARLIKLYRPDRAPSEFQRIHAAFEAIKEARHRGVTIVAFENVAGPSRAEREEPARDAAEREDGAPAVGSDRAAPAAALATIVNEPDDTPDLWLRLRKTGAATAEIVAVWMTRWERAFEQDRARAEAMLDDERLRLDAADDPSLAAACLRRIGALCWRRNFNAVRLLERWANVVPPHGALDWLIESVRLEIVASDVVRGEPQLRRVLDPVVRLLIEARIGTRDACVQAAQQLYEALASDPDELLRDMDGVLRVLDLGALFELIYAYLPAMFLLLQEMPKERFDLLSGTLFEAGKNPQRWKVLGAAGGVTAVAGVAFGAVPAVALAAATATVGFATERWRYLREVRPRLAHAILALPTTTGAIARWVRLNRKLAGRLSRFDIAIDEDVALYAFSMFAALSASVTTDA